MMVKGRMREEKGRGDRIREEGMCKKRGRTRQTYKVEKQQVINEKREREKRKGGEIRRRSDSR